MSSGDYSGEPELVANRILKSTVTINDAEIDFQPSLRRVQYDLDEIDKQINECVSRNITGLMQVVENINDSSKAIAPLGPDLENVVLEYARLDREFASPYRRLKQSHGAAQRLHQTSTLVRSFNWYLSMAKELEQNFNSTKRNNNKPTIGVASGGGGTNGSSRDSIDGKSVYSAAILVSKLENLLQANPHLQSLAVVRDHEKTLAPTRLKLTSAALDLVKEYNGGVNALRSAILTLCMFDTDKLLAAVDGWLQSQISSSVLSLTRSVASTAAFDSVWTQCNEKVMSLGQMKEVLGECFLLTRVENKVGGDLITIYWNKVAANISQKLHTMSVANPTQMKAMKGHADHILRVTSPVDKINAVFKKHVS